MTALYIVGGVIALIVLIIAVQTFKKSSYAKAVYREVEKVPDAGFILEVRTSPDEELKLQVSMLQIQVLKECYARNVPPAGAAMAMIGAINEMFDGGPPAPMQ